MSAVTKLQNYTNQHIRQAMQAAAKADHVLNNGVKGSISYFFETGVSPGIDKAVYSDGGGSGVVIIFQGSSAIIKGLDSESENAEAGVLNSAPKQLQDALRSSKEDLEFVSFCYWRGKQQGAWVSSSSNEPDTDGSKWLLPCVITTFGSFHAHANNYRAETYVKHQTAIKGIFEKYGIASEDLPIDVENAGLCQCDVCVEQREAGGEE